VYKGWQIANPTVGSNYQYVVTAPTRPGVRQLCRTREAARRWIDGQGEAYK
jgi:hypothetical protein